MCVSCAKTYAIIGIAANCQIKVKVPEFLLERDGGVNCLCKFFWIDALKMRMSPWHGIWHSNLFHTSASLEICSLVNGGVCVWVLIYWIYPSCPCCVIVEGSVLFSNRIPPFCRDHRRGSWSFRCFHCPHGNHRRFLLYALPEKYVPFSPSQSCMSITRKC